VGKKIKQGAGLGEPFRAQNWLGNIKAQAVIQYQGAVQPCISCPFGPQTMRMAYHAECLGKKPAKADH